jgi:PAS domain S-box-containing protein
MPNKQLEAVLTELRKRAGAPSVPDITKDADALTRVLHELDVYQMELEIQNQDLMQTQLQLSEARDNYRSLFEEALVPFVSISRTGIVLEINRAALQLLGRTRERIAGKPLVICMAQGEHQVFFSHISAVVESKVPQVAELGIRNGLGETRRILVRTGQISGAGSGALLCHMTDVTEQRTAEAAAEKLRKRLQESEKLEAIGRVAANIAHDVNNVLVSVIALGQFARSQAADNVALAADLDSLLDACWRGARLMRGLLGLSRGSARPPSPVDLKALLTRLLGVLRRQKPGVELSAELGEYPVFVMGDNDELFQVFLNVATNGLESMTSGRLEFRLSGDAQRQRARVEVEDTGHGMAPEVVARVFEPLFTTKAPSGGSGLGLTLAHKTIQAHHGTVEVESRVGVGTKITIELPLEDTAPHSELVHRKPRPRVKDLRIMLVDDDAAVRSATERQLLGSGVRLTSFPDGPSALHAASTSAQRFDVAIVDVNMPVWTGPEFVMRLFGELGPLPVVFVTGASGEAITQELLELAHVRLVRKPWTYEELLEAVSEVYTAMHGSVPDDTASLG